MDERTFVDAHGVEIFTRWWPVDSPQGVVLVAHGASEHSGRYDRFARALNDAGLAAVALDHRGHGNTAPSTGPGRMGPPGGDAVVDDLHELRAAAEADHPGVPVFLFGHSMGSMIGLAYLTRHSAGLAGGVLCGFAAPVGDGGALRGVFQGAVAAGMGDDPVDVLTAINEPFEPARTPFDWLSRDPDEVDRYVADPMCGNGMPLTYGYFAALFDVVGAALEPASLAAIRCPVLVIAGDQDPAAGMGANATAIADALRAAGVAADLTLYPDARHELLNETNRDEVTADIVGWMKGRVPA